MARSEAGILLTTYEGLRGARELILRVRWGCVPFATATDGGCSNSMHTDARICLGNPSRVSRAAHYYSSSPFSILVKEVQ